MSVTYVIKFQIVPGKYDDFLELLTGVLDAMRHKSTFMEAMLHADPDDANRLMLYRPGRTRTMWSTSSCSGLIARPSTRHCPRCSPRRATSRSGAACAPTWYFKNRFSRVRILRQRDDALGHMLRVTLERALLDFCR